MAVNKVRFYPSPVLSRSKMHVTVGHSTTMGELIFFGMPDGEARSDSCASTSALQADLQALTLQQQQQQQRRQEQGVGGGNMAALPFDYSRDYLYQEELHGEEGRPVTWQHAQHASSSIQGAGGDDVPMHHGPQWVYIRFAQPVTAVGDATVIGSKLDSDLNAAACRWPPQQCAVQTAAKTCSGIQIK